MAERDRPHLVVPTPPVSEPFTLVSSGGGADPILFAGDRPSHGQRLTEEYNIAIAVEGDGASSREGTYISFVSFPGLELALESLDPQSRGEQPELVAVRDEPSDAGSLQIATVYVPDGKKDYFLSRLQRYVDTTSADATKHATLIEGIQSIRRATIREMWTDPVDQFPIDEQSPFWWEVWLRNRDGNELARLSAFAEAEGLPTSPHYLGFGDRTVVLVAATIEQISNAFRALDDIAELRRPHDVANFLPGLPSFEQAEWIADLQGRIVPGAADAPAVCVVDTGVQEGHPLLAASLDPADVHTADPSWKTAAVHGHGTEMAGVALFGDLQSAVAGAMSVNLRHRLESVKFLPDSGSNNRDLYGAITARAVDQPEIQSAERRRAFMLAVTAPRPPANPSGAESAPQYEAGRPSSWSATVDALAYGRAIDDTDPKFTYLDRDEPRRPRLFIVSAGNIRDVNPADDHLSRSDLEPVEDPAQAWNALTVGAYTDMDDMSGAPADFAGYVPVGAKGELAPVSRTSVLFDRKKWPFKPDVVAEGGNVAAAPGDAKADTPENLAVLTTRLQGPGQGFFTTTRDTSAATARVASLAGELMAEYPSFRPETVRALIVHSAEWTPEILTRIDAEDSKTARVGLLRRYGMGVPNVTRALHSATDALTLISESNIRPYEREGSSATGKVREMNLHELPWPKDELEALGNVLVRLRITLSYFVEPNPSSRGWSGRYIYPSHGLRFAMRRPEDSLESFRQRINTRARAGGEKPPTLQTEQGWLFGSTQQQSAGSLHTDIWSGPAIDLANKGAVAVYPVAGWWKNRRAFDQSADGVDYSLVVSIESPAVDVDLWTPVAQQISPAIVIET